MKFSESIVANYRNSVLYANSAEYLNSKGSLEILGDVNLVDSKGKLNAESLTFDLKKQSLEIESKNNNYINTLLKFNEKSFRILKFKKDSPIFEVKDISKSFNGRPILKKLSLKVYPGECVGILGPNGSGKTTLFSMCIGEQSPESGKILLNKKSIGEIPIHLRAKEGLGYLPQQRSVFDMSVYDNILGIAQMSIKGSINQKTVTEKLLDEFNLQHFKNFKCLRIIRRRNKKIDDGQNYDK